jgi:hypothetical protein
MEEPMGVNRYPGVKLDSNAHASLKSYVEFQNRWRIVLERDLAMSGDRQIFQYLEDIISSSSIVEVRE